MCEFSYFGISRIYDSSSRSSDLYNLGNGWKTNYDMRICTSTLEHFPFYLIDSDGTEHYFYGETTKSEWKDEDGLGYTLKRDSTVNGNGYLLTDKNKNKLYFRSDGKMSRMDDSLGNSVKSVIMPLQKYLPFEMVRKEHIPFLIIRPVC